MTKLEFITTQLSDPKLLKDLATVVEDPQSLIPQTEAEFQDLCKFGLYPAEDCQPFTTKQGTPFYSLDNMSVLPIHEEDRWMHYGDFRFRQIEILYNIVRMDSVDAHNWLRDNLTFRTDLHSTDKIPVEDATATNYASNLFWGARLVEIEGKKFYFGCNVLGKLLVQLRQTKGKLPYTLPDNLHLFGKPILTL